MKKKLKTIAGCQDPGGCNAIYPVVEKLLSQGEDVALFASGHSVGMLRKRNIKFSEIDDRDFNKLDELFNRENPDIVLMGTSIGYSLEDALLGQCRKRKVPSIAVLDSWVNYLERFTLFSKEKIDKNLPDIICVMDENARREMIAAGIPQNRIKATGNPYFDDLLMDQIKSYSPCVKKKLLKEWGFPSDTTILSFFSQRIDKTFGASGKEARYLGYVQYDALRLMIEVLRKVLRENSNSISLVVRPHPKEEKEFYENIRKKEGDSLPIFVDTTSESREILAVSDIVVGMFSNSLVEAYILGKNVISFQPSLSVVDPFVLSRLGVVKTALSGEELRKQLDAILSGTTGARSELKIHHIGEATYNVMENIYGMVSFKKG